MGFDAATMTEPKSTVRERWRSFVRYLSLKLGWKPADEMDSDEHLDELVKEYMMEEMFESGGSEKPENYQPPKNLEELEAMLVLEKRYFKSAVLNGGRTKITDLNYKDFSESHLRVLIFRKIRIYHSKFHKAHLQNIRFLGCDDVTGCDFSECKFTNVLFKPAIPEEITGLLSNLAKTRRVRLIKCNLEKADLRGAAGFELDDCYIAGARLAKDFSDPWSVLRRTYTGFRAFVVLLLLIAFFLPYAIEAMSWITLNKLEQAPKVRDFLCDKGCSETRVGVLLVAYYDGLRSFTTAILLIVYNIMRAYLTFKVAPLRENEERSHYTPSFEEYGPLMKYHWFVTVVAFFAVGSFLVHLIGWLVTPVSVPAWLLQK